MLEINVGSTQPARNFSEELQNSLIERSLSLSNSWEQSGFNPKSMVGVVDSGIERLSDIAIHATHMSFYEIQNIVLLTPRLFFISPQDPSI